MKNKKVLVTGGAGFIGSHVVDGLIEGGHDVVILDNFRTGQRANLNPAAKLYELSIQDGGLEELFSREKFDCVIHHAAQVSVIDSMANPMEDAEINILGSIRVIEQCRKHKVKKFIYANSGGARTGEPQYLPVDEAHPALPISPYGISKHTVEHYLFMYEKTEGFRYTSLNYANVYGPRQDPFGEGGVVAIFSRKMLDGKRPTIYGDGKQTRDFVYVKDLVRANLLALEKGDGESLNVGTGIETSVNDLFKELKKITRFTGDAIYGPARSGEILRTYTKIDRIRKGLGWQPESSLSKGLAETVESFSYARS